MHSRSTIGGARSKKRGQIDDDMPASALDAGRPAVECEAVPLFGRVISQNSRVHKAKLSIHGLVLRSGLNGS